MSIIINANSCRITDSRNLSSAHDFLRAKILKSNICPRGSEDSDSLHDQKERMLGHEYVTPVLDYLNTQKATLLNINAVLEQIMNKNSEGQSVGILPLNDDGELSFLIARIAYLSSDLSSHSQLGISFRIKLRVSHGMYSEETHQKETAFRTLLEFVQLPNLDDLISTLKGEFDSTRSSISSSDVMSTRTMVEELLKRISCLLNDLSVNPMNYLGQIQSSINSAYIDNSKAHKMYGNLKSQDRKIKSCPDDHSIDRSTLSNPVRSTCEASSDGLQPQPRMALSQ